MSSFFEWIVAALTGFILVRIGWCVYHSRGSGCKTNNNRPVTMMVVLGSGGHTSEMMSLVKQLDPEKFFPFYIHADTDTTSSQKAMRFQLSRQQPYEFGIVPRSREVGQSYFTSIFTTLYATLVSFYLVARIRPQLILCNGPGTCIPICYSAFILKLVFYSDPHIVFVESFCRVQTLSLSGRLLYPISSRFIVQWPSLLNTYPTAQYLGLLY